MTDLAAGFAHLGDSTCTLVTSGSCVEHLELTGFPLRAARLDTPWR